MIAYYPLSGPSPLNDYSGNNRTLYNYGAINTPNIGVRSGSFRGLGVAPSYLKTSTNVGLPINTNITFSLWLKTITYPTNGGGRFFSLAGAYVQAGLTSLNRIYYYASFGSPVTNYVLRISYPAELQNKFTHLVLVYDIINNYIYAYLNGIRKSTYTNAQQIFLNQSGVSPLRLFQHNDTIYPYDGHICEFKIDDTAWSPSQVKNEYLKHKGILQV